MEDSPKIFNDPIHGHIEISSLCVKIFDTPQFQRLRDISQLGGVYYVFSGASSKRFEHCIGVSHLAKTFAKKLSSEQPSLNITPSDILCVEIAGLCHDLGHGPFSHLYDGKFLKRMNSGSHFVHEHASIAILDDLIDDNDLYHEFEKYGLNHDDIHFIKELILGDLEEAPTDFIWKGRGYKTFLYDIVANKRNGIDVDKFDYFARDCHILGLTKSFDALRLMNFSSVQQVTREADGAFVSPEKYSLMSPEERESKGIRSSLEICFHFKEAWNLFELFHTRYALHKRAYQHRVSASIELMLIEVLVLADPHILLPGKNGNLCRMSQCPSDMTAYWRLGEYVVRQIENSYCQELQPAREIMTRLRKRDLFCFVGELLLTPEQLHLSKNGANQAKSDLVRLLETECKIYNNRNCSSDVNSTVYQIINDDDESSISRKECDSSGKVVTIRVHSNDIICSVVKMGYGKGGKNPVTDLTAFYRPVKHYNSLHSNNDNISSNSKNNSENVSSSSISNNYIVDGDNIAHKIPYYVGVLPPDSVSRLIPREFEETYIRVFVKYSIQKDIMELVFNKWCESLDSMANSITLSPHKRSRIDQS